MSRIPFLDRFRGEVMNIDEDWEFDGTHCSLKKLYEEVVWEIGQDYGDAAKDTVTLHDKTVYQILVALKGVIETGRADDAVINDITALIGK